MKFFILFFCAVFSLALPAQAEETNDEIIVTGGTETTADVQYVSPGVATIEMGPLYGVFLNSVPEGIQTQFSGTDVSGRGVAHVAKWRKTPYDSGALVCWREVGPRWSNPPLCGTVEGATSLATINLGDRRSEVFALVPMVLDANTKSHLAWIAHPENTRVQLQCHGGESMASVFAIDTQGVITIANDAERARYQATHCR